MNYLFIFFHFSIVTTVTNKIHREKEREFFFMILPGPVGTVLEHFDLH